MATLPPRLRLHGNRGNAEYELDIQRKHQRSLENCKIIATEHDTTPNHCDRIHNLTLLQSAFTTVENGFKIYGTLRGAFEVGQAAFRGAQSLYQVAAPLAAALL